jgi:hypothetical protein
MDMNASTADHQRHPVHRVCARIGLVVAGLALIAGAAVAGLLVTGRSGSAPASAAGQNTPPTITWTPPPGVVQISPCVPFMGEHWARPEDLPLGPIYTVYRGRLISIEYMIAQADFAIGKDWLDLTFRYHGEPLPIEHANIEFLPQGHEGYEVPHYDLHFHVVTHAEERAIACQ